MLRSRSATNRTAWLRRTAWTVMTGSPLVEGGRGGGWSGDDPEATGPRDLLVGGQGDLQEAERLELAGPLQGAGVDRLQATRGDHLGECGLGVGVVTGDGHRGRQDADGAPGEGAREVRVERLQDARL